MRTTIQIDDDILETARSMARLEKLSLGRVISKLARRGLAPRQMENQKKIFPTFSVKPDAKPITLEIVQQANEEE